MGSWIDDLRFALRLYRHNGRPIAVVVFGLALAVGLSTALFATVRILTDNSIDLPDKASLRWIRPGPDPTNPTFSAGITVRELRAMESIMGQSFVAGSLSTTATIEMDSLLLQGRLPIGFVSGGFFQVTGGSIAVGRPLLADDGVRTVGAPVVMSHALWTRQFGGAAVVGRTVRLNGRPFTIVGVAAVGFAGPEVRAPAFWAPLGGFDPDWRDGASLKDEASRTVSVLTRLGTDVHHDVRLAQVRSVVTTSVPTLVPLNDTAGFRESTVVWSGVTGLVAFIMLLGCANVAALLAASNADRRGELATRVALGAGRGRIVRQLMVEGLALSAVGGAFGTLLAIWLGRLLVAMIELPLTTALVVDWSILTFAVAAALTSGALASIVPALQATRADLRSSLAGHGPSTSSTRLGTWAIATQTALCLIVVATTGLLARGGMRASAVDLGYDPARVYSTPFLAERTANDEDARRHSTTVLEEIRSVPGVAHAALATGAAFGWSATTMGLRVGDRHVPAYVKRTSSDFASTIGIQITRGRYFDSGDVARGAPVVVISNAAARGAWGTEDPLGRDAGRLSPTLAGTTVVGVAADVIPHALEDLSTGATTIYLPLRLEDYRSASAFVRAVDAGQATPLAVGEALRRLSRGRTIGLRHLAADVAGSRLRAAVPARVATVAAGAVLLLAAIGLGGVTATFIRQRRRELAIHLALGATVGGVRRLVVRHGLRPVIAGLGIGLALTIPIASWMRVLLYGISPLDPIAISLSVGGLLLSAATAFVEPVLHVSRISPAEALKE